MRSFHSLFGVERFVLNPYQIGADNLEAIQTGAFWFYYRLGFRPVTPEFARLAAREHVRKLAHPRERTDTATLRQLARADVELVLPGARARDRFQECWLERLSLLASDAITRAGGSEALASRVAKTLRMRSVARWSRAERAAFEALAPVLALLDLGRLDPSERAGLVNLARAKGAPQEAGYVRAAAANASFVPSLMALARRSGGP